MGSGRIIDMSESTLKSIKGFFMRNYMVLFLAGSSLALSSCTAVGVAGMAGVAVGTAAVQEGGVSSAASDARIQIAINDLWFRNNITMFGKLDLTINQGRVLITGVVQDPNHRVEAVRLAWQPRGVKSVINEIKVADSEGIIGFAKDVWITTKLRSSLILDKEVESINYSIDTVQGSVYLMGFAQNQAELSHVIDVARRIKNVRQVVSYVKLVGAPDIVDGNNSSNNQNVQNFDAGQGRAATGEPIEWSQDSVY